MRANNYYANTNSRFLLSGQMANITGNATPVFGGFQFAFLTEGVATGVGFNPNGTISLQARLHRDGNWFNIQQPINFTNSSGVFLNLTSPLESVRGVVTNYTSGAFNITYVVRG